MVGGATFCTAYLPYNKGGEKMDCYECKNCDWCSSEEMDALICPVKPKISIEDKKRYLHYITRKKGRTKEFQNFQLENSGISLEEQMQLFYLRKAV